MKRGFSSFIFGLFSFFFLLCCSVQAQTWKELLNKADSLFDAANYDSAIVIAKMALEKAEAQFSKSDTCVANVLQELSDYYYYKGNYDSAESYVDWALAIREKALGPEHPDVATSLNALGIIFWEQGKFAEAEPLYKRALAIREKALGPDHPDVARCLNSLGVLYGDQGKYAQAELLYKRSLAINKKTLGSDHIRVAANLDNLAILYDRQGRYAEAESLYEQALTIREKVVGPNHPYLAYSLHNLASFYAEQNRYAEAEPLFKRALGIWEKSFGPSHPYISRSLNYLANLYRDQHKYEEAESLYQQALTIGEKSFGPYHPYTADILHHMALLFKNKKDFINSKKKEKRAYAIRRKNFKDGFEVLSERDALTYSKFMRDEANQYISILIDSQDTSTNCLKEIAEVVFSTKGQVSDGIFARHRTEVYEKDPNLKTLCDSLGYARFKLANFYIKGPDEKDIEGYKKSLLKASEEKERLESALARQSAEFRRELELWEIDAEKIAEALPPRSILVEYLKYDHVKTSREAEPHYLSVVINNEKEVLVSDLGPSDKIDSIVTLYRLHFQKISKRGGAPFANDLNEYKKITKSLYEQVWKPVERSLEDRKLVFIAPDGELNLVSFAGLIDATGKYLIERYPIQYLSSGRDLLRLKHPAKPGRGLFALGDPDFNASALERASLTSTLPSTQEFESSPNPLRNVRSGCEELNNIKVLPLPGTRREIERITSAWKKKTREPCWTFLGRDASEENFKRNATGKKVIHLATHGYYAQGLCLKEVSQKKLKMMEPFVGENPLLLSGLFLAGVNLHGEGADRLGAEDGILTAEEVTSMDLEGTRWVVLSACESGLGEVKSGEGVYGLRRAFQMAGARTIISALWPVSDKSTAEMMSYLYGYKEENLAFAMQSLSLSKLTELRKRNQPDHPYVWAPFIALGDWR